VLLFLAKVDKLRYAYPKMASDSEIGESQLRAAICRNDCVSRFDVAVDDLVRINAFQRSRSGYISSFNPLTVSSRELIMWSATMSTGLGGTGRSKEYKSSGLASTQKFDAKEFEVIEPSISKHDRDSRVPVQQLDDMAFMLQARAL
jgi:hypothetical protein